MRPNAMKELPFDIPAELQEVWLRHKDIVKLGNPILTQVAKPVTRPDSSTRQLVEHMTRTMREAHGLGLAAPQVGVSMRVLIYDAADGDGLQIMINPRILEMKGEQLDPPEGCLSIPGLQGQVKRAQEVRVRAMDLRGRQFARRATGLEARVIQHEIDHLNGVLFIDRANPDTLEWVIGAGEDEDGNAAPRD